ncbi:MAG: hypothetical protein GXX96_10945 [Planctomycetaceae bacterium]|nr:hypothetical protein [Planctomycetaceae bacterium]
MTDPKPLFLHEELLLLALRDEAGTVSAAMYPLIVKMLALLHLNNLLELLADAAVPRACFHGVDHVVPEFAA